VSEREKLLEQVCTRLSADTVTELDAYVREREREAKVPLTRSLGVREIIERWAADRRAVSTASTTSTR
jgi:hypothetical protein